MALSEKHRSNIYERLTPVIGEEEAEALLSQYPSRELDVPVTKDFLRAELAELRAELQGELHHRLREQTMWMAGTMVTGMGVAAGIASLVG